uniref:Uncharacterized protein n=1 Tax=Cacopsylla melanoneura TaxID=428564 RepID=A0A8D8X1J4_9HEMI
MQIVSMINCSSPHDSWTRNVGQDKLGYAVTVLILQKQKDKACFLCIMLALTLTFDGFFFQHLKKSVPILKARIFRIWILTLKMASHYISPFGNLPGDQNLN